MASRSRESRREGRAPAVWRGPLAPPPEVTADSTPAQVQGRMFVSWRVFSGLIVVSLLAVLFLFFGADAFYIHSVAVGGLETMTKEEIFALTDIADLHLFWVDPQAVRESLLRSPTIADATVSISWPPQMVQIVIEEREPALVWEQAGVATWIDVQGRVMRQRQDRPDLLRIVADNMIEGALGPDVRVDSAVVNGALQMRTLMPDIDALRYHPDKGLGYRDARGWDAWFGTGTNMPEKILIYNAIVANLQSRSIQPSEINVVTPTPRSTAAASADARVWGVSLRL